MGVFIMDQEQQRQIKKIADIFLRRIKMIISFFLVGIIAGLLVCIKTPKVYESQALLIYQKQKVNPTAMSPDVQAKLGEMVSTVGQQVTSRKNLEKVIKQYNLYPAMVKSQPMEDVVQGMRSRIQIRQQKGDTFKVSFEGGDPKKVMLTTNALAAMFIEENLRYREEKATENLAYIQDELSLAKEGLDEKDAAMRDYKLKYYNEMPEQRQANLSRLTSLQGQYQANQNNIQNLEQTRLLVLEQISTRKDLLAQLAEKRGSDLAELAADNYKQGDPVYELAALKSALESLRAKYTDEHPDVKRLKNRIKKMEENQGPEAGGAVKRKGGNAAGSLTAYDPQLDNLERQLKEIEFNLARLKDDSEDIRKNIEKYKKWVEAAPVREAEWSALTRDYTELKKHYDYLVSRSLAAESAETLERRQKGSQFKIVDAAYYPDKPIKPDFRKIMVLAVAAGLGLGGGIAFLLGFLDASFRDPADLEAYLSLPVACSIPFIDTPAERKKEKIKSLIWTTAFAVSFVAIIAWGGYLWQKGYIII